MPARLNNSRFVRSSLLRRPAVALLRIAVGLALTLAVPAALGQAAQAVLPSYDFGEQQLSAASPTIVMAQFTVTGYTGSFIPTAGFQYGKSFAAGTVSCTSLTSGGETCTVPVTFGPQFPGARRDTLYLMNGAAQLAGTFLYGIGEAPFAMLQPGVTTSVQLPGSPYIYTSTVDENLTAYVDANSEVWKIGNGTGTALAGSSATGGSSLSVDGAGNIFISNLSNSYGGVYSVNSGSQQSIQFTFPPGSATQAVNSNAIAAGNDGTVYVANPGEGSGAINGYIPPELMIAANYGENLSNLNRQTPRILLYSSSADAPAFGPTGLIADSYENLFAVGQTGIFEVCSGNGNTCGVEGSMQQINTYGSNSVSVAIDAAGTLYLPRYGNGVGMLPPSSYASATAAYGLDYGAPLGSSVGPDGTVYVGNSGNLDIIDRSQGAIDWGSNNGATSNPQTITVYNGGNQTLTISAIAISGPGYAIQTASTNPCSSGSVLAAGTMCAIGVTSNPPHSGTLSGALTIASNSLNNPLTVQTVALTGYVSGIYVTASPGTLPFGSEAEGNSTTQAVTVTNSSVGSNSVGYGSTVSISGPLTSSNPAFSATAGNCDRPLASGAEGCQIQVTFNPTAAQSYSGTISWTEEIVGNGPSQSLSVIVTGSGLPPVIPLSITETIHTSDGTPAAVQATQLPIAETIHTSDGTPATVSATQLPIAETIHTSDGTPATVSATQLPIAETIHVTDTYVAGTASSNATTTSLTAPSMVTVGYSATLTAMVQQVDSTTPPTGSVKFYQNGVLLGSATLSGGIATYSTSALSVGSDSFQAVFPGNASLTTSSSAQLTVTVTTQTVLIVTALNASRNFTAANPAFNASIGNSTGGAFSVSGSPSFSTTATLNSPAGQYPITPSLGTLSAPSGFVFTFVNGTLTVNGGALYPIAFTTIPNVPLAVQQLTLTAHSITGNLGQPIVYSVSGPATISGSTLTLTGTGVVTVTATQAGNATFAPTSVQQQFTVTP